MRVDENTLMDDIPKSGEEPQPDWLADALQEEESFRITHNLDAVSLDQEGMNWLTYLDWLLEKLVELTRKEVELLEFAECRKAVVDRWLEDQMRTVHGTRTHWERQLKMNVPRTAKGLQEAAKLGKKKSLSLPHGVIGFRSTKHGLDLLDLTKALEWCERNGVDPRIKKELDKKAALAKVQEQVKATGEIPDPEDDGLLYQEARDEFFIKPKSPSSRSE